MQDKTEPTGDEGMDHLPEQESESAPVQDDRNRYRTARPEAGMVLERALVVLSLALWPLAGLHKVVTADLWWHLSAALRIVETKRVPVTEFSSWTAAGTPWFDYEWLWQLCALALWRAGGGTALTLSTVVTAAILGWLVYRLTRAAGAEPALAAVLSWAALFTARARFQARPELPSLVFFALTAYLLLRFRAKGNEKRLWLLVPLTAVWANYHPGFIFGLALVGFAFLGEILHLAWEKAGRGGGETNMDRQKSIRTLFWLGAACGVASLFTPRPFGPHKLILESVVGFRAVGFHNLEWEPMPFSPEVMPFWVLLLGTALLLLLDSRRHATDLLWFLVFGILAMQTQRSAALLAVIAPAIAAASLRRLQPVPLGDFQVQDPAAARKGRRLVFTGLLAGTILLIPVAARSPVGPPGMGIDWQRVPVDAASFVDREELLGRMFNHYRLGGYLGYRFGERRPVFADGKHIPYLPVLSRMEGAMKEGFAAFQKFLAENEVEYAVLHFDQPLERVTYAPNPATGEPRTGFRGWSTLWFHRSEWALVYWDDTAQVLVRRDGANQMIADRLEYRYVDPEDFRYQLEEVSEGRLDPAPILKELERKRQEAPGCNRALLLYDSFSRAAFAASGPSASTGRAAPSRDSGSNSQSKFP